jgi:hypothetical protein
MILKPLLIHWKATIIGGAKEEDVLHHRYQPLCQPLLHQYQPLCRVRQDGIVMIMIKNATNFVQIIVKQEMQMDHVYAVKMNPIKVVILV